MFDAKKYISNATRHLSLNPGFLLCSLRPFRMLTSAWARLPILWAYGARDRIASLVARPSYYQDVADSSKASDSIQVLAVNKNTNTRFKRPRFLPHLKERVSARVI